LINVYCENKGWLFEDLKQLIAAQGAVASDMPLPDADAYICIRTRNAELSPKPEKTVVQIHDMDCFLGDKYGAISFVHEEQAKLWRKKGFRGRYFTLPIGSRDIPYAPRPQRPTLGYFCREVGDKKRSEFFAQVVKAAKKRMDFDVLMIGENLDSIKNIGKYIERAAVPADYARITAFMTTSVSPMVPLSAYEALAAGRPVVTTPRIWPSSHSWHGVYCGITEEELAEQVVRALKVNLCQPFAPFNRTAWAKEQVRIAKTL
jgi:glycosyltransferase involved in cell wall biosynthesis